MELFQRKDRLFIREAEIVLELGLDLETVRQTLQRDFVRLDMDPTVWTLPRDHCLALADDSLTAQSVCESCNTPLPAGTACTKCQIFETTQEVGPETVIGSACEKCHEMAPLELWEGQWLCPDCALDYARSANCHRCSTRALLNECSCLSLCDGCRAGFQRYGRTALRRLLSFFKSLSEDSPQIFTSPPALVLRRDMEAWLYANAELRAQIGEFVDMALVELASEETSGMLVFNESPLERLRGLD